MLPTKSLPWYQFAAFFDATTEDMFASSRAPYFWQRILSQGEQSASSNIRPLNVTARRDPNREPVTDVSIQSSMDDFQSSRFKMTAAFFYACGEPNVKNIPPAMLYTLSVLPEHTENDTGLDTQNCVMQMSKTFMFLLSNNHYDSIEEILGINDPSRLDEVVLGMVRACNGLQQKHLLSHGGPTSEALLEKIFHSALRAQDFEVCRIALDYGIDPNEQRLVYGYRTYTPLQFASSKGSVAIACMLINADTDVNSSLLHAVESHQPDIVNLLLSKGAHASTSDDALALRIAVSHGDVLIAQSLISAGADLTSVDGDGYSALHFAYNDSKMINILLQAGADVNAVTNYDIAVFENVVQGGSTDAIQSLLDAGASNFGNAVYFAVDRDDFEMLQKVFNAGADINACFGNSRRTALTRAAEQQSVTLVKFLLESGADVNGCTLEHDSHEDSDLPSLIDRKCQCGYYTRSFIWSEEDQSNNHSPLQAASFHQDIEIAKILLDAGANVNMELTANILFEPGDFEWLISNDEGNPVHYGTAVQIAAGQGNMELVRLLYDAGADINAPACRRGGRTALQAAVENGDHSMTDFLLAAGADVNAAAAEKDGITAVAAAIMSQDPNLLSLVFKEGANLKDTSAGHSRVTALAAATAIRDVTLILNLLLAG